MAIITDSISEIGITATFIISLPFNLNFIPPILDDNVLYKSILKKPAVSVVKKALMGLIIIEATPRLRKKT